MALVLADRVLETCTSPGTGAVTLLGASTGFQTFSNGVGNGNLCYYCIADQGGSNWEVGVGTYSSSGNVLARTTPLSGSSATPVNFSSGTQNVFVTYPAEKSINLDQDGKIQADSNGYLDFKSSAPSKAAGRMWYNGTEGNWNLVMGGGNITQQVGEELFIYGKASSTISGDTTLQLIFKTGSVGASGVIQFAPTTSGITDQNLIVGVATEDIAASYFGRITAFGTIHGINTSGNTYGETWADNDVLWYNPTTGGLTKTQPTAPSIKFQVGTVVTADATDGTFQVDMRPGSTLGGTDSNVQFSSVTNSDLVQYNSTSGYWTNAAPSSITGVGSVANSLTFNNGGAGDASGSTFNGSSAKTLSYNSIGAVPATRTVSTTSPLSGGGALSGDLTLSIPQATTSTSGYLSSTDWNTFNGKGSGSVTSVGTGTGLSGGPITTTGTISLANTAVTPGSYTLADITVDAQGRITAASNGTAGGGFPSGTRMMFAQTSAPTGWTKDTVNYNNHAIRVVTGTASTGGTVDFTTAFASQSVSGSVSSSGSSGNTTAGGSVSLSGGSVSLSGGSIGATTITTSTMPGHTHTINFTTATINVAAGGNALSVGGSGAGSTGSQGGGSSHTHSLTNPTASLTNPTASFSGTAHNHTVSVSSSFSGNAINLAVKYLDVITATKD